MSHSDHIAAATTRLQIALELSDLGPALVRQRVLRDKPAASEKELATAIRAYYAFRPGAEHGDGVGHPVAWPRKR